MSKEVVKFYDKGGTERTIGTIKDNAFLKTISEDKYIFQQDQSLTLDLRAFKLLKQRGIVEIIYESPERQFIVTPEIMEKMGVIKVGKTADHVHLGLDHWMILEKKAENQAQLDFGEVAKEKEDLHQIGKQGLADLRKALNK